MRLINSIPLLILAAALAACGSSTTSTESGAAEAPSAAVPLASVVPVVPVDAVACEDVDLVSANFRTYVHYASLNVGTTNDTAPTYVEMAVALGQLASAAPECMPDAADEIDALTLAAQDAAAAFQPGDDPAAITAQKQAITALKDAGVAAWVAMGKDPGDWDTTLQFTE